MENASEIALSITHEAEDKKHEAELCIKDMFNSVFHITQPKAFQLNGVYALAFLSSNLLLVEKTGGGKSLLVLGAAVLLMGITIVLQPLIAVSADQARSAAEFGADESDLLAFHIDDLTHADAKRLIEVLNNLESRAQGTFVLYMSPQSLLEGTQWAKVLDSIFKRGLVSMVAIDEVQKWDEGFRPELACIQSTLIRKGAHLPSRVVMLAMTATLTRDNGHRFYSYDLGKL